MNETIKPSTYFLGDPIKVLPNKIINGIWSDVYDLKNGKFEFNNTDFVVFNTHYGDGNFKDTKNRSYKIENGLIALVDLNLIENKNIKLNKIGNIFQFKDEINFIYDAGIFIIRSNKKFIKIDTRNKEEYNSDFEEHFKNEKNENITDYIEQLSDNDSLNEINNSDSESDSESENEIENNKKINFFKKINA